MVGLIFYLSKMSFIRLIKDSEEGLKRKISSRREKIIVSIEEFIKLSKKYFFKIKEGENLIFNFNEKDEEILLFVLRWYYNLWIDIKENIIEVYYDFPKEFEIVNEVNKLDFAWHLNTLVDFRRVEAAPVSDQNCC